MHPARSVLLAAVALQLTTAVQPGVPNVTLSWVDTITDHFSFDLPPGTPRTFRQRVFTYDRYWDRDRGAIWFYCGNEANVELYVNATGLMWENAQVAGALLVFAEHRYYGKSLIFPGEQDKLPADKLRWLTMEQALADYVTLLDSLKARLNTSQPVIAFGGSYGGMLAAWIRMKYPASIQGSIAASAPIMAFGHNYDSNTFWQIVTRDATPAAGAPAGCDVAVRSAWPLMFEMSATADGRKNLSEIFRLCDPLVSQDDVYNLAWMIVNAWDSMAMGNFPFPSNYLVFQQTGDPSVEMPAFPVRAACEHMVKQHGPFGVLSNLCDAAGVFYNVTGTKQCFKIPDDPNYDGVWDYQWCSEMLPQETYFTLDGVHDMFWSRRMNMSRINKHCIAKYGFAPRAEWIVSEFGAEAGIASASNIVFSNGMFDPWSSGGVNVSAAAAAPDRVASMGINGSVKAVFLDNGAHHLDLMFANQADTVDVKNARKFELAQIAQWTATYYESIEQ